MQVSRHRQRSNPSVFTSNRKFSCTPGRAVSPSRGSVHVSQIVARLKTTGFENLWFLSRYFRTWNNWKPTSLFLLGQFVQNISLSCLTWRHITPLHNYKAQTTHRVQEKAARVYQTQIIPMKPASFKFTITTPTDQHRHWTVPAAVQFVQAAILRWVLAQVWNKNQNI